MTIKFALHNVHTSWHTCLNQALATMDEAYLNELHSSSTWLPGLSNLFNAFSLPIDQTHYVLFGESPYPRAQSANGYAFWDAAVDTLWSENGLSKPVNRATSLRNIIKMLLVAEGKLSPKDTSQPAIAKLDKSTLVQTNAEFFQQFLNHGFLLLNATPVLNTGKVQQDAKRWQPFLKTVLTYLALYNPNVQLLLLGNVAKLIDPLIPDTMTHRLYAEHPYNISFILNPSIIQFFKPLRLLTPCTLS